MNKYLFSVLLLCFSLLAVLQASAQSGLYVSSGSNFFVKSGTTVSLDSLVLTPSANFNITGLNREFRNTSVTHTLSRPYISRVFHFTSTTAAYSGIIGLYYREAELRGLSESTLTLNIHNGSSWNTYLSGVTRNAVSNYVSTTGISSTPLNELTLASGTTAALTNAQEQQEEGVLFSVHPNPVQDRAVVSIGLQQSTAVRLLVSDSKGVVVRVQQLQLQAGSNQLPLNMGALAAGTYTLTVQWDTSTKIVQVVKQ